MRATRSAASHPSLYFLQPPDACCTLRPTILLTILLFPKDEGPSITPRHKMIYKKK
jgi:hypothetical protein